MEPTFEWAYNLGLDCIYIFSSACYSYSIDSLGFVIQDNPKSVRHKCPSALINILSGFPSL